MLALSKGTDTPLKISRDDDNIFSGAMSHEINSVLLLLGCRGQRVTTGIQKYKQGALNVTTNPTAWK
jgi:hypothetical protein